tara:strand:+ start:512 stop:1099 length:588 start_codon:yes stop_codon:yes gene_type:complete
MNSTHKVLITGQRCGLGKALADHFVNQQHFVMYHGGRKDYDLSTIDDIIKLASRAKENNINVLVNNAAVVCPDILFQEYDIKRINEMIDVNLRAPIILSNMLIKNLTHIININSMVGLEIKSPRTLYSATKWGLRGFSNSLKKENSKLNILDVYPTNIKTDPDRKNAMELNFVVEEIYKAFINKESDLILDGRKL